MERAGDSAPRRTVEDRKPGVNHPDTDLDPDPVGLIGRVTVSIPADGPGEVLVPLRGGSEAFAAWSAAPVALHTQVVVTDRSSARSVTVEPLNPL
ncbi:hypothetical protein GCM10010371_04240 [Streptomyces subrutilus]|uniref:Uncharacterized protein n=1 Tax=Streptomyces subrutilus TaxID=36818 RepID=A0A918QJ36_9ACTN|nr:hypothetical protein GCM10010371_04240 [Streptomyces subrutilus]